jgi:hypothetical protein
VDVKRNFLKCGDILRRAPDELRTSLVIHVSRQSLSCRPSCWVKDRGKAACCLQAFDGHEKGRAGRKKKRQAAPQRTGFSTTKSSIYWSFLSSPDITSEDTQDVNLSRQLLDRMNRQATASSASPRTSREKDVMSCTTHKLHESVLTPFPTDAPRTPS